MFTAICSISERAVASQARAKFFRGSEDNSRVLVVDDDVGVQRLTKVVLSREAYRVKVASGGWEAVEVARKHPPSLVILDLSLPDLDGLEVCRRLRAWSKAPILVLTNIEKGETKIEALDLGADDYVTKPFVSGKLLARIRDLLRRSDSPMVTQSTIHAGDIEVDMASGKSGLRPDQAPHSHRV